jgi:hypothetical protein
MFATSESIVRRGEGDINQLLWMGEQQGSFGPDGDLYSRKGLGMTLLALPLVWGARGFDRLGLVQTALMLNPILTAATGALLFRAGIRMGWRRATSVTTALLFGLATMAWPYTQEFFSDPVCAFGLFAAYYGLLAFAQTGRKFYLAAGALGWALAYLARSINLVTLPVYLIGLWVVLVLRLRLERDSADKGVITWRDVLREQWRPMVTFLIPVAAAGLISLWWNWARFGNVLDTGYAPTETFSAPWLFGIAGLVSGPARGFFWYNPVLLLAIPGGVWFWRHARRSFWVVVSLTLIYVLFYGKWYMWHGGYSWGPRFLVPIVPFLALFVGPVWERLVPRRRYGWPGAAAAITLAVVSVGVQWVGMLVPFGLVQDLLAERVQPLFAPETFTQLRYSPLVLQWQVLQSQNLHFAWWRGGSDWDAVDWLALAMPLSAVAVGILVLVRHAAWRSDDEAVDPPRNYLYFGALVAITLAILTYQYQVASASDTALIARRIEAGERRMEDAILHLAPTGTQAFANTYHGRLATWGLTDGATAQEVEATLDRLVERGVQRLWVVPETGSPETSVWEQALRSGHTLLAEGRPSGQDGGRLALYALAGAQPQAETGLGTIFGDPESTEPVSVENGWFRLAGYGLSQDAVAGREILLSLRWESLRPVDYNYQVFVHLLNESGEKVAQRDGQPVQWMRPTSTWQAGERVIDRYGIPLPTDLPPGMYSIVVGLYDPVTGQRLPVSAGPGDFAIELGPVRVEPPSG